MALYAFDGTWNEDEVPAEQTNVVRFRDTYEGPVEYREGVGTRFGTLGRFLGGVFGIGGRSRVEEMYEAAKANWERGDRVFDIVGFSRGAALAVHFANVLGEQGLKLSDGSVEKPPIRFLGVWDIVGAFGIPVDLIINFQHINLGWTIDRIPDTVQRCVHAMALDERREIFDVTRLKADPRIEELWFRGVHSDIGGGNGNLSRNNIAFHWMLTKARESGLTVSQEQLDLIEAESDRLSSISTNFDPERDPRRRTKSDDGYHRTAVATSLAVGEEATFPVRAADPYNWTGVRVRKDAEYRIEVRGDQKWLDGGIRCDANGWSSESLPFFKEAIVKRLEVRRRLSDANWFALVGALEDEEDDLFLIGSGCNYTAPADADLYAFANDLRTRYGNNEGKLKVTIRRIR